MSGGFLYILINPAMPGLAKVGKTSRNPTDRVVELSSATGVPSPFILAYQQPVVECDSAELWVHKELERGGYRTSENREFFNAPLHVIVQIVSQAANINSITVGSSPQGKTEEQNPQDSRQLADELYRLGMDYAEGTNQVLKNEAKALSYFEQAAALDHVGACAEAASRYWLGEGSRTNLEKALTLFSKAVVLGNWWHESSIAELFRRAGQKSAAEEHWKRFFDFALAASKQNPRLLTTDWPIGASGHTYCGCVMEKSILHCVPDSTIVTFAETLKAGIKSFLKSYSQYPDKEFLDFITERGRLEDSFIDAVILRQTSTGA